MLRNIILLLIILLTIFLSGLFSGAETGMYRLSRLRLRLGIERKKVSFILLGKSMRDSTALLLSILIGNNLTHYVVTSIITFLLLEKTGVERSAELFATLLTAPILFVFAELIPKSVFYYRSDKLMPIFGPVLFVFHKFFSFCGAVGLLRFISGVLAKLTGSSISSKTMLSSVQKRHIRTIFTETQEEGLFSPVQTDIINRLVSIPETPISSIMTPLSKVENAELNCNKSILLNKLQKADFTRLLVYEHRPANIAGWINIFEAITSPREFEDLKTFIRPIRKLSPDTDVITAINIMQQEKEKILLVAKTSRSGKEIPLGVVTMKDLAEELLGELAEW
ncbi:CNNM domain-containing protein [Planctomycetota bacterium]